MSTFKLKPEKTRHIAEIRTLDETHRKIISDFQARKRALPKKKKKLSNLNRELQKYESKDSSSYTTEDIKTKSNIKSDIAELKDEIYDIENNISELEYYSQTDDLLMDYYDIVEQEDELFYQEHPELSEAKPEIVRSDDTIDKLDLLNMLNKSKKKKPKKPTKRRKRKEQESKSTNIMSFFGAPDETTETECSETPESVSSEIQRTVNRAELYVQYRMLVDNEFLAEQKRRPTMIKICGECGEEKTINPSEGLCVCLNCGEAEMMILDSEKPNYKDSCAPEKPGYPYKRSNHLSEWLAQFQAKESTEIPESVYEQILAELRKERVTDFKELSLPYMKKILKKLNLTSYYEHRTHIISKLSGSPPPTITRDTEERIRTMFRQIQAPFEKHCPPDRVNFLSYSYVLHKFFELLELDNLVDYFPLLKSRDKLRQQDKIWEKICEELRWEFIPSV